MKANTRSIILDILMEINENDQFSNVILKQALNKYQYLEHSDRAFISRVVRGSVERKITLDYFIDAVSKVKTAKMKPVVRNIMRMSVYQIMYMDAVTDYAVCNEAVKLAAKRGFQSLRGFVNGVLRNICRNKESLSCDTNMTDSVKYSMPQWIIDLWEKAYGSENTERLLKAQYLKRPLAIRCNTNKCSVDQLIELLEKRKITVSRVDFPKEALLISGYDYIDKIPEFDEGFFTIQDISSMLVGSIAAPKKENLVVDVCAAPGSKTTHVAAVMENTGKVIARDISDAKVSLIDENAARLSLTNIETQVFDATVPDEELIGKADIVIADLPCSGLGIIGRKPDIKYNMSRQALQDLSELQRKILSVVSQYVKPGGKLIYSTCTLNPQENRENAEWIAENLPFELMPVKELGNTDGMYEIMPDEKQDGFFISQFVRKRD